jgi:hypothetical protein
MAPPEPSLFHHRTRLQIAFMAGLLIGEGSFTGDLQQPHCALKMSAQHERLLRLVHSWYPLSRFYGPYAMPGNRQDNFMILWRGMALHQLVAELEDFGLGDYCPHVHRRMMTMKARYTDE